MANNNENISINVEINADGQQQLNQYKSAFDGLRTSISNLSIPITKLDNDISKLNDSLNQTKTQSDSMVDSVIKVANTFTALKTIYQGVKEGIELLKISFGALEATLTGGLSVIVAFIPEIINFTKAFIKGKEATNEWAQNFKNLNEVMKAANKDAAEQTTILNVLYKSATAFNNTYADRLKYANQLKAAYPEQFKNMTAEEIANGKAKKNYEDLAKSILASAKAKAALNKMTEQTAKLLDADYQIEKIKNANYNEVKNKKEELSKQPTFYRGGRSNGQLEFFKKESDDRAKTAIEEQDRIKRAIQANIDYLMKFAKDADTFNTKNDSSNNSNIKTKININTGDQSSSNKKPKAKIRKLTDSEITAELNADAEFHAQQIKQTADAFNKEIEQYKDNYAVELAGLKNQLDQKLISQDKYFEEWTALQERHHTGIGESIKLFNEKDLAQTQQHQKDLVEAEQLSKDQHDVDKAVLPANKLAAEKQLITDKYNFEIQKAAEAGKDTADIRQKYQQEMAAADKQFAQQRKDFELQTAQQVSNAAFSILQNSIKSKSDSQVKQLETQKQAELNNSSLTASQKQAIEDKYKKKEAEVKVKAFKDEQKASILQAVINGALAITKTTAQTGAFAAFVIPGIIAETAIQVATIAAQKPPQYAKGGLHYQSDGKGTLLSGYSRTDNTNAYLRSGEAVVVSEAMRNPWARNLVSAINVAHGGRDFSITNPGRGYAIGGIFTDGGNSNRYYNQPMNDQKDLANTIAYQMINNFPPVYVDVKDINSQQNILAQTVNRVNL